MNKFQFRPGQEGLYQVHKGRALHWPSVDGKPVIWARPSQYVDLRSPFLCAIAQKTGQLHKLFRVESVPADADVVSARNIPSDVREAMQRFEAGNPASVPGDLPGGAAEQKRSIDMTQLPSAAEVPAEAPEPEAPADLKYTPPVEDAPEKPRAGRKGKKE